MTDRYCKKPVEVRAWKIGFDGQEPDWVREAFDGGLPIWRRLNPLDAAKRPAALGSRRANPRG